MKNTSKQQIFFLDDEIQVCKAVSETLEESGFEVSHFTRAAECLEQLRSQGCDLLITDLKMPKMDGIEVLTETKRIAPWTPVLVITGYGDIPTAVTAIHAGAADFIEKPLDRKSLIRKVTSILQQSPATSAGTGKPLTETEMRILKLVINGKNNKQIANSLHRSVRTVEVHRAHLMEKLSVDSLIGLVRRAAEMGFVELSAKKDRRRARRDSEKRP